MTDVSQELYVSNLVKWIDKQHAEIERLRAELARTRADAALMAAEFALGRALEPKP